MKLSPRLAAIARMIPRNARLCDAASDHAYLPIYLIQTGAVCSCIASDISVPCVARARENAARAGVEDVLAIRLSDGLKEISPDECDCISMSGLGGETIIGILEASPWALDGEHLLILQPASRANLLRRWLYDHDCGILDEQVIRDAGRLYPLFSARAGVGEIPPEDERAFFAYASRALLDRAEAGEEEPVAYIRRLAGLLRKEQGHDEHYMSIVLEIVIRTKQQ